MSKLALFVKKNALLLSLIFLGLYNFCYLIYQFATIGDTFFPIIGSIIAVTIITLLCAALAVALILKKAGAVKILTGLWFFFSLFYFIRDIAWYFSMMGADPEWDGSGMEIAAGIFGAAMSLVIATAFVFVLLGEFFPTLKKLRKVSLILMLSAVGLSVFVFLFRCVYASMFQYEWFEYFWYISEYLALLPLMSFLYIAFFHEVDDVEKPAIEETTEQKEEPVEVKAEPVQEEPTKEE